MLKVHRLQPQDQQILKDFHNLYPKDLQMRTSKQFKLIHMYNLIVQIYQSGGWICFGYLPANQLANLQANPKQAFYSRAVAVCTDNTFYNYYGPVNQVGSIQRTAGTTYTIAIEGTNVVARSADRQHIITFPKDPNQDYLPWVEINGVNEVGGSGVQPAQPQPSSQNQTATIFTTNADGANVVDNRLTNTNGLSQFVAQNSVNSDWEVTQVNNHPGGWICFGYLPANQLAALRASPKTAFYSRAVALCTDNTFYNYFGTKSQVGTIQRTAGTVYSCRIQGGNVVIRSQDGQHVATYLKDPTQDYIPWVEINNPNAVTVRLLEIVGAAVNVNGPDNATLRAGTTGVAGNLYTYTVPADAVNNARVYGYSFWIRPCYTYPTAPNWGVAYGGGGTGLAGWTEQATGDYAGVGVGDRGLAIWLINGAYGPQTGFPAFYASSYQMNNGNPNQDIRFPNREDFDSRWIFVHASYSYELSKAKVYAYFSNSNQNLELTWTANTKRWPVPSLKFRLGTSIAAEISPYNFLFKNVKIFHGLAASNYYLDTLTQFVTYRNSVPFNTSRNTQNDGVNTVLGTTVVTRSVTETNIMETLYNDLDGVTEYAVYGWARWSYTPAKQAWHLLFRFCPFSPADIANAAKPGDRQLVTWVGDGYLHVSTSTFNYYSGQNPNMPQNINYGENLENWFFFYQGYSFALKRVAAYVKWVSSENNLVWESIYHQLPTTATFWLGKDPWHATFNGDLKQWKVHLGVGAFRQTNFQELYSDSNRPPPPFILNQTSPAGDIIESPQRVNVPAYFYEVPVSQLAQVRGDYSYSFWYRFNYFYPTSVNLGQLRSQYHTLSILSETNSQGVSIGDRTLAVWIAPIGSPLPNYHATTYDTNPVNGNVYRNLPMIDSRDFDSYWNFVYFGYNREETKAFFYSYHSRSGNVVTSEWTSIQHQFPVQRLAFTLGGFTFPGINGHYFNPQLWYTDRNYLGTRELCDEFRQNRATAPRQLLPPTAGQQTIINSQIQISGTENTQPRNQFQTLDAAGAEEFGIYGWWKWNSFPKAGWHNLFRVSEVGRQDGADLTNANKQGDRTFCMWLFTDGNVYPATYSSDTNTGDNWNLYTAKPHRDDLESWFWVYMGYSNIQRKVVFYVKWASREDSWVVENHNMKLPYRLYVTVGGEGQWHNAWNGNIRDVHLFWGPGSFRERNYTQLQNIPVDTSQQLEEDNFWNIPAVQITSISTQRSADLFQQAVPNDQLANVDEFSFSFWFRMSYEDPSPVDINIKRSQFTSLAGVTERVSYGDLAAPGDRALGLWLTPETTGFNFWASTYATNRNNNDHWQNLPFPNPADYDSVWNFVYFGYSYSIQKAFFYVKFGSSNLVRTLEWPQTAHLANPAALKFQLGQPQQSPFPQMVGRYHDVRFRWDNLAFKASEQNLEWYLSNSVQRPTQYNPSSQFKLTNGIITRDQLINPPSVFEYPVQLNGARSYSIYGWAKWVQPTAIQAWNNLFRVTILDQTRLTDASKEGSRTLALWYNAPGRYLHIKTYRHGTPAGDDFNLGPNKEAPEIDQWFFIYMGYDVDLKKRSFYVKFASSEWLDVTENLVHKVPSYIGVYLGRDTYYPGWNGQLKGWYFNVGAGSYRQTNFSELYNRPVTNDLETDGNNVFYESHRNPLDGVDDNILSIDINRNELNTTRKIQVWTWFNWQYLVPSSFGNPQVARGKCYHIARLVYTASNGIQADLCFNNVTGIPSIKFTETSQVVPQFRFVTVPDDQDLSSWNFIYLAHNEDLRKSIGVIKFQRTRTTKVLVLFENKPWNLPSSFLGLRVSGRYGDSLKFNGLFFDAQISNSQDLMADTDEQFDIVYQTVTVDPNDFDQDRDQRTSTPEVSLATLDTSGTIITTPSTSSNPTKNVGSMAKADSYQVFGWVKWTGTAPISNQTEDWTLVYRFAQKSHQNLQDESEAGDRALALFVSRQGQLKTSTYDFRDNIFTQRNNDQPVTLIKLNKWFFVYHAYSRTLQKSFFALKCSDGQIIQRTETNLRHLRSSDNILYLGKDKFPIYGAWNGHFRGFQVQSKGPIFISDPALLVQYSNLAIPPEPPAVITLPPTGDCPILYNECNYTGQSERFCDGNPRTNIQVRQFSFINNLRSIYIPQGWFVKLWDRQEYQGRNSLATQSVECLQNGVQFHTLFQTKKAKMIEKNEDLSEVVHKKKQNLKKNRL